MKYLILLLLFLPIASNASEKEAFFKYGLGMNRPFPDTDTRFIALGYRAPLVGFLDQQVEGGMIRDNGDNTTVGFVGYSVGLRAINNGIYAAFFIGPALLTGTDGRLGSIFEFNNDLEIGVRDAKGHSIGLNYTHLSNAGLFPNNIGRDFLTIKLGIEL